MTTMSEKFFHTDKRYLVLVGAFFATLLVVLASGSHSGTSSGSRLSKAYPPQFDKLESSDSHRAFHHWSQRTRVFWEIELTKEAVDKAHAAPVGYQSNNNGLPYYPSTSDAKFSLGYNSTSDNWFQRVYFTSKNRRFSYNLSESSYITNNAFRHRVSNIVNVFQGLVDKYPQLIQAGIDFDFYVDVTDATRTLPKLFKSLARPILVQGNGPEDMYTIPIPDPHQLMGMNILANWSQPDGEYAAFAKDMANRFDKNHYNTPWKNKVSGIVYRGDMNPTFHTIRDIVWPRAEVCGNISKLVNKEVLKRIDIGFGHASQDSCSCCYNAAHIDNLKMANNWRYQLNIDGFGASYDGSFWKLSSYSTVFHIIADPVLQKVSREHFEAHGTFAPIPVMWNSWFSPMLLPNEHYISIAPDQIDVGLQWCEQHEPVCEKIANNARAMMTSLVSPDGVERYLKNIIHHLQKWQRDAHATFLH
jgi:hypothetical protein